MTRSARLVLGAFLSLGAAFLGFFAILGMAAIGVPDPPIRILGLAAMGLGATAAAQVSPRLVPSARLLAPWRRVVAGVGGIAVAIFVAQALRYLGVNSDDHDYSMAGLIQQMAAMATFYLSMVVAAAACLGRTSRPGP